MLENLKSMDNQRVIQPYKENIKNKMPQLSFKIQKNKTTTHKPGYHEETIHWRIPLFAL